MGCLGVVHVPKAGGSAVRSALGWLAGAYAGPSYYDHAHFGTEALRRSVPPPNAAAIVDAAGLADLVAQHRLVMGHYAAPSLLVAGCDRLAVQVREPRARLLSLYRFWQSQDAAERASWGRWGTDLVARADQPLAGFLAEAAVAPAIDNALARQLLGRPDPPAGGGGRGRLARLARRPAAAGDAAAQPYERLGAALVVAEWSDRSERFVAEVYARCGDERRPDLQRENVTPTDARRQALGPVELAELDRLTAADRAVLSKLCDDGLLERRSAAELDDEFAGSAQRLGFDLVAARPGA